MAIFITMSVYGCKSASIINEWVEIPEHYRVVDLLQRLQIESRMPQKFGNGDSFSEFLIFVNGINVMIAPGLGTVLHDLDVCSFFLLWQVVNPANCGNVYLFTIA